MYTEYDRIQSILVIISTHLKVNRNKVFSLTRAKDYVLARKIMVYILAVDEKMSHAEIKAYAGIGKDTLRYYLREARDLEKHDRGFHATVSAIRLEIQRISVSNILQSYANLGKAYALFGLFKK